MPSYLVHFNRLHDKRGRFTYGDGDGDGRRDDRKIGEGDRSYDTPNSGRRNYEGGGGGRIGGGRTRNGEASKREQVKENDNPFSKREQQVNRSIVSKLTRGDGKNTKSNTTPDGKRNIDTRTGDIKTRDQDRYAKNPSGLRKIDGNTLSGSRNYTDRNAALESGKVDTGNRLGSGRSTGTHGSISKFGPVTPKTPGLGDGSGRSKGDWSGNSSGSNYTGTSRGAGIAPPPSNSSTASSELSDEMTDMLKKDQTKDNIRKKYEDAVEKGKDFVDKVFGGKETSTNAKSSDKYTKTDNAGKHGYDKRK